MKEKFMPLKSELLEFGMVYAQCNLDTLPENFIKSGEKRLYLIDWEYSGKYDKLWYVATIGVECSYKEQVEELFLRKYFDSEPVEPERRRIKIQKIMQDMCWSMWATSKVAKGDENLSDYTFERFTQGKANLSKYLQGENTAMFI
jgi:thiamine kinase-like enzyme